MARPSPAPNARAFFIAYAYGLQLDRTYADASRALNAIPGISSGRMGLTPDSVKATPAYRAAKDACESAFALIRSHNARMVRRFPVQNRAASIQRRTRATIN